MGYNKPAAAERSACQGEPTTDAPLAPETFPCHDVFDISLPPHSEGAQPNSLGAAMAKNENWYVLQVTPNRDALACKHLEFNGIETYSPTCKPIGTTHEQRIFPGYVFTRLALPQHHGVVDANPYAIWILGAGSKPIPVPDAEVLWIREMAAHKSAEPSGAIEGDWVRVVRGPMASIGVEGRVMRVKGALRLVVELTILGRGVSVEIDRRDVEVVRKRR